MQRTRDVLSFDPQYSRSTSLLRQDSNSTSGVSLSSQFLSSSFFPFPATFSHSLALQFRSLQPSTAGRGVIGELFHSEVVGMAGVAVLEVVFVRMTREVGEAAQAQDLEAPALRWRNLLPALHCLKLWFNHG